MSNEHNNVKHLADMVDHSGVSITVVAQHDARMLERLLATFFQTNTHQLVEWLIVDPAGSAAIERVIDPYVTQAFIRYLPERMISPAAARNLAVRRASNPYLLFLSDEVMFVEDALPAALAKLSDDSVGVVGVRLDDDPAALPPGQSPGGRQASSRLVWNPERAYHLPTSIRFASLTEAKSLPSGAAPAVNGAFLLCRQADFTALGGFCEDYIGEDLAAADFCLLLQSRLDKACYGLNAVSVRQADRRSDETSAADMALFGRRMERAIESLLQAHLSGVAGIKGHEWGFTTQGRFKGPEMPICQPLPTYELPIVVVAYNRPAALLRLLHSLDSAQYHRSVPLLISVDGGADNARVVKTANDFHWRHGPKSVRVQQSNLGLKAHVMACGDLALQADGAVVLEDDLLVSPVFYSYVQQAFDFYHRDDRIAGISLYAHQYNETAWLPFTPLQDQSDAFFMQLPSSWGVVWGKQQWAGFKHWLAEPTAAARRESVVLPGDARGWPASSWKRDFFQYVIDREKFFVYPRISLTTNFGEDGVHMRKNRVFQAPLRYIDKRYEWVTLDQSFARYDGFCELLPEVLHQLNPDLAPLLDCCVDLYGTKPLAALRGSHVVTTRKVRDALRSFGKELRPLEANLLHEIEGKEIFLTRVASCGETPDYVALRNGYLHQDNVLYHYAISQAALNEVFAKRTGGALRPTAGTGGEMEQELRDENELLLLQLHQVQEELEHYFLECQEMKNQQRNEAPR